MNRALAAALAVLLALAADCGGSSSGPGLPNTGKATPAGAGRQLTDLRTIGQLKALFNAHAGEPRLVVLVSPT